MLRDSKSKRWVGMLLAILGCLGIVSTTWAGTIWLYGATLQANDAAAEDGFGHSVAVSGQYAVVGAPTTPWKDGPGRAYVFKHEGNDWVQKARLTASDGVNGDDFGASVSISGDYVIVGAPTTIAIGGAGAAYIFEKPVGEWSNTTQTQKITCSGGEPPDHFGCSVSIDGGYAMIGAWGDRYSTAGAGRAYIFKREGSWVQKARLTASDREIGDCLGYSVSISGNYAIAGNYCDDDNGTTSGSAYIFEKLLSEWTDANETAKLTASDAQAGDEFGWSVSIEGSGYVIIGAPWEDRTPGGYEGAAYIFKREGSWVQKAKLTASDYAYQANLGHSVSMAAGGVYVITGAYRDNDNGNWSGSAYIYAKPAGEWENTNQHANKLALSTAGDEFGCSVALDAVTGYTLVGAHYADNANNCGMAPMYHATDVAAPALSQAGLTLFIVLLLITGVVFLVRRRSKVSV